MNGSNDVDIKIKNCRISVLLGLWITQRSTLIKKLVKIINYKVLEPFSCRNFVKYKIYFIGLLRLSFLFLCVLDEFGVLFGK